MYGTLWLLTLRAVTVHVAAVRVCGQQHALQAACFIHGTTYAYMRRISSQWRLAAHAFVSAQAKVDAAAGGRSRCGGRQVTEISDHGRAASAAPRPQCPPRPSRPAREWQ